MSHIVEVELVIQHLDLLEKAAEYLGLEWRDQRTYRWYGRSVGDYPLPEGVTEDDLGKCEFAIGVPGNKKAYEVGVVKRKDGKGYSLQMDFFAGGFGLCDFVGEKVAKSKNRDTRIGHNCFKLANCYAAFVTARATARKGYSTRVSSDANGRFLVTSTSKT